MLGRHPQRAARPRLVHRSRRRRGRAGPGGQPRSLDGADPAGQPWGGRRRVATPRPEPAGSAARPAHSTTASARSTPASPPTCPSARTPPPACGRTTIRRCGPTPSSSTPRRSTGPGYARRPWPSWTRSGPSCSRSATRGDSASTGSSPPSPWRMPAGSTTPRRRRGASVERFQEAGDEWWVVEPLGILAGIVEDRGDLDGAAAAYEAVVGTSRIVGEEYFEPRGSRAWRRCGPGG